MVEVVLIEINYRECWPLLHALACLTDKHPLDEKEAMIFRNKLADAIHEQKVAS